MTVIQGEYITFKHVKTRKVVVLEIEVAEERFQEVIATLGMPIGGESKPVAVALLDKTALSSNGRTAPFEGVNGGSSPSEATNEGDKLRVRAVMLCKEKDFQNFTKGQSRSFILATCNIKSRADLVHDEMAQVKFKELLRQFDAWKLENRYPDEIGRMRDE